MGFGKRFDDLDDIVEEVQEMSEADYSGRMHIDPEYDVSDDVLRAFIYDVEEDEETAEEIYEEIKSTNYSSEEIKGVLDEYSDSDGMSIELDLSRRGLIKGAAAVTAGSYPADSLVNYILLSTAGQDHFEPPASSYHERAVSEMLEGNEITIQLYNIRFDDKDAQYNEQEIVNYVEKCINELEGTNFQVEFQNLNATKQGILDEDTDFDDLSPEVQERVSKTVEQYRDIIKNNTVLDPVEEENSQWVNNNTNMASQIDAMVGMLTEELTPHEFKDIKVAIADFEDGDASGVSTFDHQGTAEWAFVDRNSRFVLDDKESAKGTIVHEIGHKLGLPHTKYPDFKRNGLLPDIMSYSRGMINIPDRVHSLVDGSVFGKQSHHNWEKVKEEVRE